MKNGKGNSEKKDVLQWIKLSDYDIKTAKAMQEKGRYLYVLFCCQQAVEKRLKALVVKVTQTFPPKLHDLIRLADLTRIDLNAEQKIFLRKLANYYIETRYPEETEELSRKLTERLSARYFKETNEMIKCIDQLLN